MKKGVSQLDWIFSLAIFLLYITWLFAFLQPSISINNNLDSNILSLRSKFSKDFSIELRKYPLLINHDSSGLKALDYNLAKTNILFDDPTNYIIIDDHLLLLKNIDSRDIIYFTDGLLGSSADESLNINVEEDNLITENITVYFDDSLPEIVEFKDDTKIKDIVFYVNGIKYTPENVSYEDKGFLGLYESNTENLNFTHTVLASNSDMFGFYSQISDTDLVIELDLENYDKFYSNNLYFGDLEYDVSETEENYQYDYVIFYDDETKLTFAFDEDVNINISSYNTTLKLVVTSDDLTFYRISFGENISNLDKNQYRIVEGLPLIITAISNRLIKTDYGYLKNQWDLGEFYIVGHYINSDGSYGNQVFEIGSPTNKNADVYAETHDEIMVINNKIEQVRVNYRIW